MICVLAPKLEDPPIGDKTDYQYKIHAITRINIQSYTTNIFEQSRSPIPAECAINSIPVTFGAREYNMYMVYLDAHHELLAN